MDIRVLDPTTFSGIKYVYSTEILTTFGDGTVSPLGFQLISRDTETPSNIAEVEVTWAVTS